MRHLVCRIPDIKFAGRMREKTQSYVLSVDLDDPSTSNGITEVAKKIIPYIAVTSECGHVRKKTCLMGKYKTFYGNGVTLNSCFIVYYAGDQGLSETSYHSIYARSSEEKPGQRLSPLVPQPQEWHSMKATYHPLCALFLCALLSPAVRNVQIHSCHV